MTASAYLHATLGIQYNQYNPLHFSQLLSTTDKSIFFRQWLLKTQLSDVYNFYIYKHTSRHQAARSICSSQSIIISNRSSSNDICPFVRVANVGLVLPSTGCVFSCFFSSSSLPFCFSPMDKRRKRKNWEKDSPRSWRAETKPTITAKITETNSRWDHETSIGVLHWRGTSAEVHVVGMENLSGLIFTSQNLFRILSISLTVYGSIF